MDHQHDRWASAATTTLRGSAGSNRAVLRRVLGYARPYRRQLIGFVAAVIAGAVATAIPPLLFRSLIDNAVPDKNRALVAVLALAAVGLAFANALLSLVQRWFSARIGEGLIYDLRVALFDHVQRMPLAFFTRTQTGCAADRGSTTTSSARSRRSPARSAPSSRTSSASSVTLTIMFALEWRLTILTLLVLPAFIFPARRLGPRLQALTREGMQLNAEMNNLTAERFNVAGALVAKLFGRPDARARRVRDARARGVRDIGVRTAMYGRVLFVALGLVAAVGTAVVYLVGGNLAISGAISTGTVVAFVLYVGQIYQPLAQLTNARVDVLTALVSFERVFEVLDFPPCDRRPARRGRRSSTPRGPRRVRPRLVPAPAGQRGLARVARRRRARPAATSRATGSCATSRSRSSPARRSRSSARRARARRRSRCSCRASYDVVEGAVRVDGHDVRDLTLGLAARRGRARRRRTRTCSTTRSAPTCRFAAPDATDAELEARAAGRAHLGSRRVAPRRPRHRRRRARLPHVGRREATARDRARAAEGSRDRDPRRSDVAPRLRVGGRDPGARSTRRCAAAPRSSSRTACRRSSTPTASSSSTAAGSSRPGTHDELLARGGLYADLYRTQLGPHAETA